MGSCLMKLLADCEEMCQVITDLCNEIKKFNMWHSLLSKFALKVESNNFNSLKNYLYSKYHSKMSEYLLAIFTVPRKFSAGSHVGTINLPDNLIVASWVVIFITPSSLT